MYECVPDGSVKLLQAYVDDDPEENFYCCTWSYDTVSGLPLLAAAGAKGIVRIISPKSLIDIKVCSVFMVSCFVSDDVICCDSAFERSRSVGE